MGSVWMQLALSDPTAKAMLAAYVPALADPAWVRFCCVAFFSGMPMLQSLVPGFNPLGNNPLVGAPSTPAVAADKKDK